MKLGIVVMLALVVMEGNSPGQETHMQSLPDSSQNLGYVNSETAYYSPAAQVLIDYGLRRLLEETNVQPKPRDTLYVSYGNDNPPSAFLEIPLTCEFRLLPYAQKPKDLRDHGISISIQKPSTRDTVQMVMYASYNPFVDVTPSLAEHTRISPSPWGAGATATLVRKDNRWDVIDWRRQGQE